MKFTFLLVIIFSLLFGSIVPAQYSLYNPFPNISVVDPVDLQNSGDGTNRIFVVEQAGRIKVFPNSPTVQSTKTFLDITDRVSFGGERGLLGLAFHPNYKNNGYFYVNYTVPSPLRTRISRFTVSSTNPDSANKNSELILLTFNQPAVNHNGGWVGFGPNDGYLYINVGDGGGAGDILNNAQNLSNLLGTTLRIDVDNQDIGLEYAIPPDNPFIDSTGSVRKEIYVWGLRNPWRSSFDPVTGWLWCADVGQSAWEEIDIIENGKNYGWRCYEGNHPYNISGCAPASNYIFPVWEYARSLGYSITGGYVYRGPNVPELTGKYIYADYGSNRIWTLEYDGINPPTNTYLFNAPASPTSFGVDENNEVYFVTFNPDGIYAFTPTIPVELSRFSGTYANGNVNLEWTAATETNNLGFDVERATSLNPPKAGSRGDWRKIGFVEGYGTTTEPQLYSYLDNSVKTGTYFYRLKQIDFGGQYEYSDVIEIEVNGPLTFGLEQNYPNPFNPSTLIKYSVAENGFVKLSIYNLVGEEISVLVNEQLDAGFYEVGFNATNLPSCTYFYKLQAGNTVHLKKMILLK
jgi:glucose/arabinose dehydrogenase